MFLQLLHFRFKSFFGRFDICITLRNLFLQLLCVHCLELCDQLFLLLVAEVYIGDTAHRLQVFLRKLLQAIIVTRTRVILQRSDITPLNGGKALDTVFLTEGLACTSAINISNDGMLQPVSLVPILHQLVPSGLHSLTVASPRRQKFDEDRLSRSLLFPILWRELEGTGKGAQAEHDQCPLHLRPGSLNWRPDGDETGRGH
mmetsp:Transcript_121352/g.223374  ORF Transcript_121352/g.223374 Transcript_121352/m.223374 type:complete len:201 (+) Transcript_121352:439-1041(+)